MNALHIDENRRAVLIEGTPVALGARAFDVLLYLSQNADRVITKEELLDTVWAGVLVEESNLTVQIAGLRKALGKEAIKTVPGVGYKFTRNSAADRSTEAPRKTPLPVPTIPSLAVLPFANLTGDDANGYMVDGVVNEITNALARVSSFFVIFNTSTFTYRGKAVDLTEVGAIWGCDISLKAASRKRATACASSPNWSRPRPPA